MAFKSRSIQRIFAIQPSNLLDELVWRIARVQADRTEKEIKIYPCWLEEILKWMINSGTEEIQKSDVLLDI